MGESTIVNATDLVVRYNDQRILDGATLAISEGDRLGLVGRNGCGKTTFLKIIAGLQTPDAGTVTRRRDLVTSYLPQDLDLDPSITVEDTIREGARFLLDLITEFESLPGDSKRHIEIEQQILHHDGWTLDTRIATAMAHLDCPAGDRLIHTLSGGEKRRVALCRSIISRPDFLLLDEPTNHLDPDSVDWLAQFLEEFPGSFLVVTHDRYFLDRVVTRMTELSEGRFFSHEGNYTDYLLAKAERQASDAVVEHKRQMFLKRELAWVRQGPRAQRSKQKNRFERYYDTAAQEGPVVEQDVDLCIPPPPALGNRTVEAVNLGMSLADRVLFRGFNFNFQKGQRVGVAGRNGLGKTTLLRCLIGEITPTEGEVKTGQLTQFNYVDQARLFLNEENTLLQEISDGTEFVVFGEGKLSLRAYLKRFLFPDERMTSQVKYLSGGERSRLLLAKILKQGGNFLILDEPTNDLDLGTLRVLEEALIAFPGVVLVVSHDRYFLNRVCTDILAFEGDERIRHSVGDYDYYLEKRRRAAVLHPPPAPRPERARVEPAGTRSSRPRKLTFKEARELEGMEQRILDCESNIARIEALFAQPDYHKTHAERTSDLLVELQRSKDDLAALYTRWEELESIRNQGS